MAWNSFATPLIGKAVRAASRLAHGGGSAFPGKIVERIDPQFLARTLQQLPLGVVLVSGTNGKTTTTRMVASMLESLGLKVFTNPTGSNFTRGVVSSLLAEVSLGGKLDADIAVLELDEAYAVHFVKQVQPDYCLLLNVMRDQLDRFGEIDNTARLLSKAAEATTGTVVLNREDPRIARLADVAHTEDGVEVRYFGLDGSLRSFFPSDDDMRTTVDTASSANIEIDDAAAIAKTGENAEKSDEAYAVHFVKQVQPDYCLLLNVMRDQLDRFGEIDNTARLLSKAAEATTGTVVLNREDPRIARLADVAHTEDGVEVRYFGLDGSLRSFFPSDDDMRTTVDTASSANIEIDDAAAIAKTGENAEKSGDAAIAEQLPADVTLLAVGDHRASFGIDGETYETGVRLEGVYNLYNAAAALAVVRAVVADAQAMFLPFEQNVTDELLRQVGISQRMIDFAHSTTQAMIDAAAEVTPAFGRGEVIDVNGSPVELLLVKNPMGFRLSLASFTPEGCDTMIAINDEYADGRDMSWLWDVDFSSLRDTGVAMVSGVRAWDMALRLEYDQVPVNSVNTELEEAVSTFVNANPGAPKHIYCTYTAMLKTRAALGKIAEVADAGVGK